MIISKIKLLLSHGQQYIPQLDTVGLPETFTGVPLIVGNPSQKIIMELSEMCPSKAICNSPFGIDMGRCLFCRECERIAPSHIHFTSDYHMATQSRDGLIVTADHPLITVDESCVRSEIKRIFGRSLRLRQVSAGGDNSSEMELNASMNVNFDFGRYGIEFVASPRHADGIVITGPVTENMAVPMEICYNAVAHPKIVIVAGTDAISGGIFADSPALNRSFFDRFGVDLYVAGNPIHPLTFIHGVMDMLNQKMKR